jgi:hypothetical protein
LPSLHALALSFTYLQPVAATQLSSVQALLSLQTVGAPGWHVPPPQTSPVVQALPSLQAVVLFVKTQPVAGAHVSVVQTLLSLHTVGAPGLQVPPPQTSPVVHALPSLHELVLFTNMHPEAKLQMSLVHGLPSLQTTGVPATHAPPLQKSLVEQALPSMQRSALFVKTHAPVVTLQLSVVHTLLSLHVTGMPGWQVPLPHASPLVQALPSLHGAVLFVKVQAPVAGLQPSVVHTLLSLHTVGAPGMHVPPPQTSPVVQALPSLQALVLFAKTQPVATLHVSVVQTLLSLHVSAMLVKTQPVAGLHVSAVQALPSLHTVTVPGLQVPPPQTSPTVQALPSLQTLVLFVCTQPVAGLHVSVVQGLSSLQALVLFVKTHPVAGSQLSVVQASWSSQTTVAAGTHEPPPQTSPTVQAFPSLHAFVLFACEHPLGPPHTSSVQVLPSSQRALPLPSSTMSLQSSSRPLQTSFDGGPGAQACGTPPTHDGAARVQEPTPHV